MTAEPLAYAADLRDYAGSTLDGRSLHSWMVQRLMLDLDLEHAGAAEVVDEVLAQPRPAPRRRRHVRIRPRLTLHRA
jgi:hypothetical protein